MWPKVPRANKRSLNSWEIETGFFTEVTLQGTDKYLDLFAKVIVPGAQREASKQSLESVRDQPGWAEGMNGRVGGPARCKLNEEQVYSENPCFHCWELGLSQEAGKLTEAKE